jgi:hypothetical protein
MDTETRFALTRAVAVGAVLLMLGLLLLVLFVSWVGVIVALAGIGGFVWFAWFDVSGAPPRREPIGSAPRYVELHAPRSRHLLAQYFGHRSQID